MADKKEIKTDSQLIIDYFSMNILEGKEGEFLERLDKLIEEYAGQSYYYSWKTQ